MKSNKLWYLVTLIAFALLPLAGCSGGSGSVKATEKGTQITVDGKVDTSVGKSTAKSTALTAITANTVEVYDAQDGTTLGSAAIDANGSFSGLKLTLPATKTILVFKATFGTPPATFLNVVPIDLSNPPAAGIVNNNPINIELSQRTTDIAKIVSSLLGLTGDLGDAGQTLTSVGKTYTDAALLVVNNGGQQLAYSGGALGLNGKFSSAALLPALDANNLDANTLNNTTLDGSITSVAIPGNNPIVSFQVINKTTGKGIRGLKNFNLVIAQLKPGANGSPSEWLSYMVTATSRPTTDVASNPTANPPVVGYSVIDNGDGSYTVKFAKDIKGGTGGLVVYNANLTHRLMVGVRSTPSVALQQNGVNLSNFYNEKYFIKDFVPATPDVAPTEQRDMTTTDACNECHGKIGVTTPHGGRGDVKYCMMCHTAQRAIGRTNTASVGGAFPTGENFITDGEVLGDFVTMIHKIHMGTKLTKTGYDYAGVAFNGIVYPKPITNCRQCHKGDTTDQLALAPQANNWKEKPSRKSCGSCHDNINFATGANAKVGGLAHVAQADDSSCVSCHGVNGSVTVETSHASENATPNNPITKAGLVNFFYEISSVTVAENLTAVPPTSVATIKFRIQQNTGSLTAPKTNVVFTGIGTTASPLLTGFTGSPAFLLAYYQNDADQPTATNNADYNNLGQKAAQPKTVSIANLADGTRGTLSAPDANGFYTATLSGAANNFPVGAKLRAVGLQAYFTQVSPAAARHALSVVKEVTGDTKRREVIDSTKCGKCHEWFEGHGGNRVAGLGTVGQSICALCHVPNLSTSGRGAQKSVIDFIIANPVGTSLTTVANFLGTVAAPNFTGTISQGAKDAMTSLLANLGTTDPTLFPEASNNFKDMIHGVHAGNNSLVVGSPLRFVRDRGTSGEFDYNFQGVTFVGVLKDCRACHKDTLTTAGAVDNTKATYTSIPAAAQSSTQVTTSTPATVSTTGVVTDTGITLQTAVGVGNNVTKVDADRKSVPNAADLVNTPFTATCKACHSKPNALAHFKQMGGSVGVPRSQADPAAEACVTCHGTTGPNALFNVHRFSVVGE